MRTTSTINKFDEQGRGHEDLDAMQTTTASMGAMATVAETPKQEQKRVAGKYSDPLIAPNTASSLSGGTVIQGSHDSAGSRGQLISLYYSLVIIGNDIYVLINIIKFYEHHRWQQFNQLYSLYSTIL